MLISLVFSGGTIAVIPSRPTVANRTPSGLAILIDSGAAANPCTGAITIRWMVRLPCHRSRSTGLPAPAIQAL
jgi:hypothetical protein